MMGTRITDLPIATEEDLEDATVDYVLALVNGVTKLIPTSMLVAPDTTAPAVPTGLSATPGDEEVVLNWDDNGEGDLARYDYRIDAGSPVSVLLVSGATVTGLTNEVEYDFQVRAVDTSNNASAWSAIVSATPTPPDITAPATPTGLVIEPGDTELYVSWAANAEGDLDHYDYRVDGGTAILVPVNSTTVPALTNGVEYDIEVRAVDTSNNASAWCTPVTGTPDTPPATSTIDTTTFGGKIILPGTDSATWDSSGDPTVVYLHGAGSSPGVSVGAGDIGDMLKALCQKLNRPILVPSIGNWGNPAAVAAFTPAVVATEANNHMGTDPDLAIFIGASAGGILAAAYTKANPTNTAGIIGLGPVCDLQDMVTNNRGGHAAGINSAYGGTYVEATYGASHNPVTIAANGDLVAIPYRMWYGEFDAVCVPAASEAFLADVPLSTSQKHGGGHNGEIHATLAADMCAWIKGISFGPSAGATTIESGDLVTYFDRDGLYEAPSYPVTVDVLVVGGGASGGVASAAGAAYSGGGGAGQVVTDAIVINGPTAVTVGRGGMSAGPDDFRGQGTDGEPSIIGAITAAGGSGGGSADGDAGFGNRRHGRSGTIGGGGGIGYSPSGSNGGTGTVSNGAGGLNYSQRGGGGGGAGGNASASTGGNGVASSITGASVTYGGGGGGGVHNDVAYDNLGQGGTGGGGDGWNGYDATPAFPGTDKLGGGGGGTHHGNRPGKGGSGVVIIRRTP